ncbi:MAG: hypothetical protein RIS65_1245, partial [Pseudomonadota bacterium]
SDDGEDGDATSPAAVEGNAEL